MTSKTLLDTDILSALLRRQPLVVERATHYLMDFERYSFSLIIQYEILRGLKAKQAVRQLAAFDDFCQSCEVLPISEKTIRRASDIYADLYLRRRPIGDADILIAATALEHDLPLSTNNESHFSNVMGLNIDNWLRPR